MDITKTRAHTDMCFECVCLCIKGVGVALQQHNLRFCLCHLANKKQEHHKSNSNKNNSNKNKSMHDYGYLLLCDAPVTSIQIDMAAPKRLPNCKTTIQINIRTTKRNLVFYHQYFSHSMCEWV